MPEERPTVCVDLDGVLNAYDGFRGGKYYHDPRPGAHDFLRRLNERGYRVVILTVRWKEDVEEWLARHDLARYVDEVTDRKPPAHVYVDDRAICFRGDFEAALDEIARFKAHWE